jgi:N-methylhydantoinase A
VIRLANTRWPGRSAWSRSRSAPTRATSRSSPSAARGRCTPPRWRASLAIPRVLVPARPGLTNALGCVVADLRHDFVRTLNRPLDAADMDEVHAIFAQQEAEGRALVAPNPSPSPRPASSSPPTCSSSARPTCCACRCPPAPPPRRPAAPVRGRLSRPLPRRPDEIRAKLVNLNCSVIGVRAAVDLRADRPRRRAAARRGDRGADRPPPGDGSTAAPRHAGLLRANLPADAAFTGPAIVEQMDATLVSRPATGSRPTPTAT